MLDMIVRLPKVKECTGLSRTTIYRKIKEGDFPPCIRLGARSVGWKMSIIQEWINSRATMELQNVNVGKY